VQQNETEQDNLRQLSPKQEKALQSLLLGDSATDAAAAVGVHRTTLHRWQQDPTFQAAMNRERLDLRSSANARLQNMQEKAIEVVDKALDGGDVRSALSVLRGLGFLAGDVPKVGLTDPTRLRNQQEAQEKDRKLWEDIGYSSFS